MIIVQSMASPFRLFIAPRWLCEPITADPRRTGGTAQWGRPWMYLEGIFDSQLEIDMMKLSWWEAYFGGDFYQKNIWATYLQPY